MQLNINWFTEGRVDFELQKYRLLAYLQEVRAAFGQSRLYPQFTELLLHHKNLIAFQRHKAALQGRFPRRLKDIDLPGLSLSYRPLIKDDELMQTIGHIVAYALDHVSTAVAEGTHIYDLVADQLQITPVGLLPEYKDDGYLLVRCGSHDETRVYTYTTTLFEDAAAPARGVRLTYVQSWPRSMLHTYEYIKKETVRKASVFCNPAFYCLETGLRLPINETILPVAVRRFGAYISR